MSTALETLTGLYYDFRAPSPEQIDVRDVARGLAHTCRFGGHTKAYYSVAEHALLVARLVRESGAPRWVEYGALHHDSHEAYIGDVPTPLKALLGREYARMRSSADVAIGEAFGINPRVFHLTAVREADAEVLRIEAAALKVSNGIGPHWGYSAPVKPLPGEIRCLKPGRAEFEFLLRHRYLRGQLGLD